jgi:crossover junction endodeoxyribonuclease RuvC
MLVNRDPLRVLGIDPGLTRMGVGVVEESAGQLWALDSGTIKTSPREETADRLKVLFLALTELLRHWQPQAVATERLFFKLNAQTAVPAMQASGVALLAAAMGGVQVHEYTPAEVKQAVVGYGDASKNQIRFMVERILGPEAVPDSPDAADGLAVAITHLSSRRMASLQVVR